MAIMRWDPFKEMEALRERMDRLFEDFFGRTRALEETLRERGWLPPVDIYETEGEIILKADLPGVKKEDVSIEVKDNVLTLQGERKPEDVKPENYYRMERSYGTFQRSFSLPSTVDQERIRARFRDGVLEIVLPKLERAKPKAIPVETD